MISAFGVEHEVSKSFMPTKGELGVARSISEMGPDVRNLLRENLGNAKRLRTERGGALGSLKKPSNAADRHPRAVEAAHGRFHTKRLKAWEAKGSPKTAAARQPRKVRQAAPEKAAAPAKPRPNRLEAHEPLSGRTVANIAGATAIAGSSAYAAHHLRKSDDRHAGVRTSLGAVAGAAGADAVHEAAGQGLKIRNAAVRRREWDNKKHRTVWDEHRRSHGVTQVTGKTPESVKNRLYRTYPKELPGWKGQRVLAHISHPAAKAGILGGAAVAGGAIAYKHREVKKAHDPKRHAEEGAAAAAGAAAGQGAYQSAGYETKHLVDRKTRKGHPGVTPEQVRTQDKALKENKKRYGMYNPNGHPDRNNVEYHRNYPKQLPYSRHIRTLGHTHEGKLGMAAGAGATALGAVSAFGVAHHVTKKPKPREIFQ